MCQRNGIFPGHSWRATGESRTGSDIRTRDNYTGRDNKTSKLIPHCFCSPGKVRRTLDLLDGAGVVYINEDVSGMLSRFSSVDRIPKLSQLHVAAGSKESYMRKA